jgi:CO/xanthine dehydrogenase Mo-binding subunit
MADQSTPYVGQAMKRIEDPRLVKGAGTYTDDVRLPGMLHASILRSPYAHARIQKIDLSAAYRVLPRLRVYTSIENLFDKKFDSAFGFPSLPFAIRAGVTVNVGGDR